MSGFQVINVDQGSVEWHHARAGCITASMFKVARSKLTRASGDKKAGDMTDKARTYAFRVAFERISGKPMDDDGLETWQMRRGTNLEPAARREHEIQRGVVVQRAGIVKTPDGKFGGSADGLIGTDGGSEYKCLVSPEGLRDVLLLNNYDEFLDQVHGCMWVTGRKWWHLCFYCPHLEAINYPLHVIEVKRDDDYIELLERDLLQFEKVVCSNEDRLRHLKEQAEKRLAG